MTVVLACAGALLVVATLIDLGWTTVAAGSGAGPLTARLARRVWQVALAVHARRPSHTLLSVAGVAIVFAVLAMWMTTLFVGWSLVFASATGAVRDSHGVPADGVGRIYFAGYTIFTLGNGDYRPGTGVWQLATVAATASGLLMVTLAITYLVPLASAVAQRRQLASYVAALGDSPTAIVVGAWTGRGFGSLNQHLTNLAPLLHAARQLHLTYPMLHHFHSVDRESAAAISIARLALAIDVLRDGVAADRRPDPAALETLDRTIDSFLETLAQAYIRPAERPLPAPDLAALRAHGVPTVDDGTYRDAVSAKDGRRCLLAGYLAEDGWRHDAVTADRYLPAGNAT